jgi:hypothetical protein
MYTSGIRPFAKPLLRKAIRVHGFAAWPQRCGHGTTLVNKIAPIITSAAETTGRPVIAVARTTALAAIYQRWGLHPITTGARVMLGQPVS